MTTPNFSSLSPLIRFPNFSETSPDLNELSVLIQDLSLIYDVTGVAVLPEYGEIRMPRYSLGPRRNSPLREEDRLRVKRISLASPFVLVFYVTYASVGSLGVLSVVKSFIDVLSKGLDVYERARVIGLNRALAREELREARLRNDIRETKLQRIRGEPSSPPEASDQGLRLVVPTVPQLVSTEPPTRERGIPASQVDSTSFAQLIDEPIRRVLEHGGGELEITGDEDDTGGMNKTE